MALQGTLDTFALPDVLRLLAATRKTGRLRITGGRGTGSLWVDEGAVAAVEATHAPHATEPVDALFELLRFEDGSFTFDPDARHAAASGDHDVEALLGAAEALLSEWREIESVVPSLDAWVTLRPNLGAPEVSIDQARWTTVVAVGAGATVRRMGDELCLAELPISRAVRDLVELGVVDVALVAPTDASDPAPATPRPLVADSEPVHEVAADDAADADGPDEAPLPTARPIRARRPRSRVQDDDGTSTEPELFVPLDLPVQPTASYDPPGEIDDTAVEGEDDLPDVDDLAAAFPGLASRTAEPTADEEELARQLATLSPRAADAVRAAAEASTDEERDAALEAVEGEDGPINRGLLLKFLSSVKG